jgi:hypothetical protein
MLEFCFLTWLQFAVALLIGLPIGLLLANRTPSETGGDGWLLLTPAIGVTVYLAFATTAHFAGLGAEETFFLLLLPPVGLVATFWRNLRKRALWPIGLTLSGAVLAIALNAADLTFAGLDYFPLTNDDTFSYLGLVDQIREAGWIKPTISYPAGFQPLIGAAVDARAPGAIFIADLAQAFRLETHTAFFVTQRMFLPVTALGAAGVVMLVTGSLWGTCLCLACLIFGNTLLHQMLDQFNSSAMGTIIGTVVVALLVWSGRTERSPREAAAGCGLAGFAVGTMAITSMEAHPFYLCISGLIYIAGLVKSDHRIAFAKLGVVFFIGYLAPSILFLPKIWPQIVGQYSLAPAMPGQSVTVPGFLIFLSGVSVVIPPRLMAFPFVPMLVAVGTVLVSLGASAGLLWRGLRPDGFALRRHDALVLGLFTASVFALEGFMYATGIGYGLLKIADYFAFLNAVAVSTVAVQIAALGKRFEYAAVGLFGLFCVFACFGKDHILSIYRGETMKGLLPNAYRGDPSIKGVDLSNLTMEQYNLYLYENRMGSAKIQIPPGRSHRFGQT